MSRSSSVRTSPSHVYRHTVKRQLEAARSRKCGFKAYLLLQARNRHSERLFCGAYMLTQPLILLLHGLWVRPGRVGSVSKVEMVMFIPPVQRHSG